MTSSKIKAWVCAQWDTVKVSNNSLAVDGSDFLRVLVSVDNNQPFVGDGFGPAQLVDNLVGLATANSPEQIGNFLKHMEWAPTLCVDYSSLLEWHGWIWTGVDLPSFTLP